MTLKELLTKHKISQRVLADGIGLSGATINNLVNTGTYPKSLDKSKIDADIAKFLQSKGVDTKQLITPKQKNQTNQQEYFMLLRKQTLTLNAKKHFGLFINPFTNDVRSADELFLSNDVHYVREAMFHTARHGGFVAITGESGAGKTTLKRDLADRISKENQPIIVIEPYILATEDNDIKGKTLKSTHIAESILHALAPLENAKRSPEARFRQIHQLLKESHKAGNKHLLIIEEAHSLPLPTLKHLKRFFELEDGYNKLLGIVLIGQNELALKLSEQNPAIREVVQRCEIITLDPIAPSELASYLSHRLGKQKPLNQIIDDSGILAITNKLVRTDNKGKVAQSLLYPLAIGNLLTGAMNMASELGVPVINADVIHNL